MTSCRAIAERSSHRFVVRRRLPSDFGRIPLYVSSEGGLRYLVKGMRNVDPTLLGLTSEWVREGHVVWDVGANLGLFSFAAAAVAGPRGRVLAIEPDTWLVGLLRRSAAAKGRRAPVEPLAVALGDEVGLDRLAIAVRSRATSHLEGFGTTQTGGTRGMNLVAKVTLDWLLERYPAPDIVKIDVEGAEAEVLDGGRSLLQEVRPVVLCEVSRDNARVTRALRAAGYRLFDGESGHPRQCVDRATYLTLALPDDR